MATLKDFMKWNKNGTIACLERNKQNKALVELRKEAIIWVKAIQKEMFPDVDASKIVLTHGSMALMEFFNITKEDLV